MANSTGSLNCIYASAGGNSWQDASYFYAGKSGTWYRTKVVVTTGSFTGQSSCLKISININGQSSPCGCWGVLTTNGSLATNKVMNDSLTGPHSDLTTGCIAQSCSYSNEACTTEETGTNKQSGYVVYYKFSSSSLQPNTTYYAYFCYKSGRGSSSGWTQSNESRMSTWVEYTPRYTLTCNKGTGVASFSANPNTALSGNTLSAVAKPSAGYHLTQYSGTTYNGASTDTWTDCAGTLSNSSHTSSWTMSANRTITCSAARNTGTVYYYANGGTSKSGYSQDSSGKSSTTSSVNSGSTAANLYNVTTLFQRTGYHVYNNNADATAWRYGSATATSYLNQASQDFSSILATSNEATIKAYANWEPNVLTVIYNANGGTQGSGSSYTLPLTTTGNYEDYNGGTLYNAIYTFKLQRTGYHLDDEQEWYTSTGTVMGDDTTYTPAQMATNDGKNLGTGAATINVYANWKPNTYTVTYNANGGSGSMANSTATYNAAFITRQCIFTRASHKFIGWNEKADGSGTWWYLNSNGVYESGNSWTWTYTTNITLYAQWELTTVYVSVYNRDGSQLIGTLSGDAGTSITIPYSWSDVVEEELDAGTAQWYDNDSLVDETLYSRKETYTWDGTYFDVDNEDTYATTFTLPQYDLELWAQYSPSGDRKIILQAPPSPRVEETEICKGWGRNTYVEVTPGSWVEFKDNGSTPTFSAFFQPQYLTHQIYKQDDGRYYYGTTLAKIRNKWQNVNSTFVKYNDHWMTLKQFISDYGDLSLLNS